MILGDLPREDLFRRLAGLGLVVRMGPFQVRIHSRIPAFCRQFAELYRYHTLGDCARFIDFDIEMATRRSWNRRTAVFKFNGDDPLIPLPIDQAMPLFEWGLNWCIVSLAHRFVMIHAGVVAQGDEAILMPGASGSGKSTLTTALSYRGWRLLSDEMALIDLKQSLVYPMPRPISLKNKSIDVIKAFAPDVRVGCLVSETHKGQVALLQPPAASVVEEMRPARIKRILFPIFDPTTTVNIIPVSPGQAFVRLYDSTFNYGVHGQPDFTILADVVERASAAEVRYRDLDAAIAQIGEASQWPAPLIAA